VVVRLAVNSFPRKGKGVWLPSPNQKVAASNMEKTMRKARKGRKSRK